MNDVARIGEFVERTRAERCHAGKREGMRPCGHVSDGLATANSGVIESANPFAVVKLFAIR